MTQLYFEIPSLITFTLCSDADIVFGEAELLLLKAYIPGLVQLQQSPERVDITVQHYESENRKLVEEGETISVYDTWNGKFSGNMYHLLYGVLRKELLERNIFSVHAASVEVGGKNILICGHSGAGKTSVVLKLLEWSKTKLQSGNKTLVSFGDENTLSIGAGTTTLTIKEGDKSKLQNLNTANHVELWNRIAFTLDQAKYQDSNGRVEAIIIIRLNDYSEEFTQLSENSAVHALYPYFLDAVNADIILNELGQVFDGNPSNDIKVFLLNHLKELLKTVPVYSIVGSSDFVASKVSNL